MFCSTESTGGSSVAIIGTGEGVSFWGEPLPNMNVHIGHYVNWYKEVEEDLWMVVDRRKWREYLKTMWLRALKFKGYFTFGQCGNCKFYCRRLLISISGWLAREGYAKKN